MFHKVRETQPLVTTQPQLIAGDSQTQRLAARIAELDLAYVVEAERVGLFDLIVRKTYAHLREQGE